MSDSAPEPPGGDAKGNEAAPPPDESLPAAPAPLSQERPTPLA